MELLWAEPEDEHKAFARLLIVKVFQMKEVENTITIVHDYPGHERQSRTGWKAKVL